MGRLHSLALGGWDGVLHGGAVNLGDGMAVFHLHRDELDLGIINLKTTVRTHHSHIRSVTYTVLGGDLPAGVLHGGGD